MIEEDIEDLEIINKNKENIENYQFDKIIKKYGLNDYIISIMFKNKKQLRVLSKFFFDENLNDCKGLYKLSTKFKIIMGYFFVILLYPI